MYHLSFLLYITYLGLIHYIVVGPLMRATDFWNLVGLGLENPRSLEGHTTKFYNHFNYYTGIY